MGWEVIATGDKNNLENATGYENEIAEGQRGRLDMTFSISVPDTDVTALRNSLSLAGITDVEVISGGDTVSIYYRKGAFWIPVIIALVVIAFIAVMVYLILWKLSKEVPGSVISVAVIGAAVLAFGLGLVLFRSGIKDLGGKKYDLQA